MPTGTQGRSRSPSPDRSHNRSQNDSYDSRSYDSRSYTDYSDEFYSDEDSRTDRHQTAKNSKARKPLPGKPGAAKGKSNAGKLPGGKGPPKGKPATNSKGHDYATNRMLSARRLKINELRNENEDLKTQLVEVARENKLLMRTANQQDKKLHLYEDQENDLPRIIAAHNEEMRATKEQLRRQKEKGTKLEHRLKERDEELNRTQRSLKKMKALVEDKKLDERDSLARKLSRAEADSEDKDKRISDLEKHIENLQKNHKHELGIERARYREAQKDVLALKEQVVQLKHELRDLKRDLDINNIYANRALKAGRSSTRTSNIASPAPSQRVSQLRKNSQENGMSTREKAKVFEAQRREQERQNREQRHLRKRLNEERTSRLSEEPQPTVPDAPYQPQVQQSRRVHEPETLPSTTDPEWLAASLKNNQDQAREAELVREEELADQRAFQEERDRRKREAEDNAWQEQERERRVREEQEQREREEKERREREDTERREREQQDRERKEREDIERRAREERERMENDERIREQQRQKASLLAKMKALEKDKEAANVILNDPFAVNTSPTKLPTRKTVDIFDDPFSVPSSHKDESSTAYTIDGSAKKRGQHDSPTRPRGTKPTYNFGKPIENLHNGVPSHDNVSVPVLERHKRNRLFDEDSDGSGYGGYQPTFTSNNSAGKKGAGGSNTKAKKNLMNDLFGGSSATTSTQNRDDDIFGELKKPSANANRRRPGGNIQDSFGGENPPMGNSHLLPRRGRQPTTTFNSPAINAVDAFDDDLEEVIL